MRTESRRVAQVCLSRSWGSKEIATVKMTRQFEQRGYESYCICHRGSPIHQELERLQLNALPVRAWSWLLPLASKKIFAYLEEARIQALYCHDLQDLKVLYPALRKLPELKVFAFARSVVKAKPGLLYQKLYERIYGRLQYLIALSQLQRSHVLARLPLPDDRCVVIPSGVDTQKFKPRARNYEIRRELGVADDEKLIAVIGSLGPYKGQSELVEAAYQVLRSYPKTKFVMVGAKSKASHPEMIQRIQNSIEGFGIKRKVVLTGFRNDIPQFMNALDIFCMPAYEENFPVILLEALASGVPSIGTNAGGVPEIIEHGINGILVEPGSSASLAFGIQSLLQDPSALEAMALNARRKALEVYDHNLVFDKVASLLDRSEDEQLEGI